MALETLAEILGHDPGTPRPNAYQLFGLKDGETDSQVITAAIRRTLRQLKASQQSSDPNAWKKAAAAVTKARKILTDADAKAAYDAKRLHRPRGEAIHDPLQGLLPQYDPLAAFDLTAAAERVATLCAPQPTVAETVAASDSAVTAANLESEANAESGIPGLHVSNLNVSADERPLSRRPASRPRRRRGVPWAVIVLTVMVAGMLVGIGFGIYLLTTLERQTGPVAAVPEPAATGEIPDLPQDAIDPVIGSVAANDDASPGNFLSADEIERTRGQLAESSPPPTEPPEETAAEVPMTEPSADPAPSPPDPPTQPNDPSEQPSEAAGEVAIEAAKQAILENRWTEMKTLAANAVQAAADDEQKARAERLFQLADLADYYYAGLMQSLQNLEAGDQIELENIGIVGVVEANETTFAIQVSARPKSFEFDKIPFFVVDAIAKQSMDLSDPTTRAAKAVHQAISVNATPQHRRQSLDWLAELPDTLEGATPEALQEAIHELYPSL